MCVPTLCFQSTLILKKLRALSGSVTSIGGMSSRLLFLLLSGKQTGSKELPLARISENGQEQKHSCAGFQQVRLQDAPGVPTHLGGPELSFPPSDVWRSIARQRNKTIFLILYWFAKSWRNYLVLSVSLFLTWTEVTTGCARQKLVVWSDTSHKKRS